MLLAMLSLVAGSRDAFAVSPPPADGAITLKIEPERKVLASDTPESIVVKVALLGHQFSDAKQRPAVNLALVIDRSGSMGGRKIEDAKEAAIAAVQRLDAHDIVSVVVFDSNVETLVPAQSARNKDAIIAKIRAIRAGGSTAIFGGVSQAASEIRKNIEEQSAHINRIVLLSDGQANVGPASPVELGRLGVALMKERISVSTIGLGLDYNEDLMVRLAEKSDGNTYFVENSNDLPRIFSKELGDVLSVVGTDVKLRVAFKNGATPIALIGRDGRIEDGVVTIDMNQIYGGQEKYVLIKTEFTVGADTERRHFADAEVSYTTVNAASIPYKTDSADDYARFVPFTAKQTVPALIAFSKDQKKVVESADKNVVKEVVLNINAAETDRAIDLADQGKREEAAKIMFDNRDRSMQNAIAYDIDELKEDARQQQTTADNVRRRGLTTEERKESRAGSYQKRNQQKIINFGILK